MARRPWGAFAIEVCALADESRQRRGEQGVSVRSVSVSENQCTAEGDPYDWPLRLIPEASVREMHRDRRDGVDHGSS